MGQPVRLNLVAAGFLGLPRAPILVALLTGVLVVALGWWAYRGRSQWSLDYQRREREQRERERHAARRMREFETRQKRGQIPPQVIVPPDGTDSLGALAPSLPVWVALGAPIPSRRLAPEVSNVRRPKLALPGRMSGDLPYLESRPRSRSGTLWVDHGTLVFVQSDQDDVRLDESYIFEVPAASLLDLAPTHTSEGRPAIELVGVPETLTFELDGDPDPEAVVARVRDVMAR
jgi:hypothetical protein